MRIDLFHLAVLTLTLDFGSAAFAQTCDTGTSRPFDQAPVGGNPTPVATFGTTTFEAEHYNCGGEGQGYHDNTPGNQSTSTYRNPDSVDINDQTNGLRTVQFFDTGEWMAYTINAATTGSYTLGISAASGVSGGGGGLYRIEIDGVNVTGSVPVPTTPDWETPQWVDAPSPVSIAAGTHTLKLVSVQQSYRVDRLRITAGTTGSASCGTADLCVSFETADTQFNTPPPNSMGPHITTTTLGTLVWNVENKGDCSDVNVPACRDRLSLVNFGRDGGSALYIATLDNDLGVQSTTQERSEISIGNAQTDAVPGRVQWWAHSVFFPLDSNIEPQGTSMLQFHPGSDPITCSDCGAPNFILTIQPKTASDPTMMFRAFTAGTSAAHPTGVDAIHGQYDYFGNGFRRTGQCLSTDYQKGVWYDFVHRIKWSYTDDGSHEIWMRKAGTPVKKVLNRTGINTLYLDGSAELKLGVYHPPVAGNTSIVIDRIRRSTLVGTAGADAVRMADFPVDLNASVTNPDGTLVGCPDARP
jgi:hypothetical protein